MNPKTTADAPPGFLGTGWAFPPQFGAGGAQVDMVGDAQDVHQALQILFATQLGERPMREDFGCNLDSFLFAEIDHELIGQLRGLVENAVLLHEPRIRLLDLQITPGLAGVLDIRLDCLVLATNSRFNMVFPFYINEASAVAR